MKKTVVIALVIALVLAFGAASVYAAGQIARVNAISEEAALNFACVDAGIRQADVEALRVKFGHKKGAFVYDIEFAANGVQYDYTVDSASGAILEAEREMSAGPASQAAAGEPGFDPQGETAAGEPGFDPQGETAAGEPDFDPQGETAAGEPGYDPQGETATGEPGTDPQGETSASPADTVGVDRAVEIALEAAGLSADGVAFSKTKLARDDGRTVYEIEFYITGEKEYEYEIDAQTGEILDEDIESWDDDDD